MSSYFANILSFLLCFVSFSTSTDPVCSNKLSPTDHASKIYVDNLKWKEPKTSSTGQNIQLECSTGFIQNEINTNTEQFSCNKGLYNGTYKFADLLCKSDFHKYITATKVSAADLKSNLLQCNGQGWSLYEVSRILSTGGSKVLYRACLDQNTMRTKFVMKPASSTKPVLKFHSRESDVWGFDGYGKTAEEKQKLSTGYVLNAQRKRTTAAYSHIYNQGKQYPYYFNRGHLVAYADFEDHEDQKGTVEYINAAPQWDILNKNSWNLVEREVREILQKDTEHWEVYTGTYGSIPSQRGPLFLVAVFDNNGRFLRGLLPVPRVFWKIVFNTKDRSKSRVFLGVNEPAFRTAASIEKTYILCANPIKKNQQIFQGNEFTGFTYECSLEEFLTKLHELEKVVKK